MMPFSSLNGSMRELRTKSTTAGISGILWLMKFTHHGLQIEIPFDWWTEAGMRGFVPTFTAYRGNQRLFQDVREVLINVVCTVSRNPGVGIYNICGHERRS